MIKRFGIATNTTNSSQFRQRNRTELDHWSDPTIRAFLEYLMIITIEDVKQGFKICREKTSTSLSGRKLPLHKIWLQNYQDYKTLTTNQFFKTITDVINLSKQIQYPLNR